jgi:penicillin amidase
MVVLYIWLRLVATLPITEGHQVVKGLIADVTIRRDSHGVPAIQAANDSDAFFAVGYIHAQDRLWQLELQRRTAYGRLSEVLGQASVSQDLWFRTLDLHGAVRSAWSALSEDARVSLTAYAAGINAWLELHYDLPLEFQLLSVSPRPWTGYDSLACMKLLAFDLSGNFQSEIRRLTAARAAGPEKLQLLFPSYSEAASTTVASVGAEAVGPLRQLLQLQSTLRARLSLGGRYVGSNAWVVAGRHTQDGAALLANDPHLGLQIPSRWYALRIQGASINVSGMSLPGAPIVLLGKNQHVAWGVTNMMADTQDLFIERVIDASRYQHGDSEKAFEERIESIEIRPDFPALLHRVPPPLRVRIRTSVHGPIVSDMFAALQWPTALRWAALDADDTSYEAFLRLNYARDWTAFQDALRRLVAPALNMLYADVAGNIGYAGAGRIPVRGKGDGTLPIDGGDVSYEWRGYIPFDEMPRAFNPPSGYLISANNRVVGPDYKYFISSEWAPPARADRIAELLTRRLQVDGKLTVEDMMHMQADVVDLQASKLLSLMLRLEARTPLQAEALRYLGGWSGEMSQQSPAAAIFQSWGRHVRIQLFSDDLSKFWPRRGESQDINDLIDSMDSAQVSAALTSDTIDWCSNTLLGHKRSCDDLMRASLDMALRELGKLTASDNMADWQWGSIHRSAYDHVPFGSVRILDRVFNRGGETGGSRDSINVAESSFDENRGYVQFIGATMRQVIAIGRNGVKHLYVNSTGQSGNVVDSHYDDMIASFHTGSYFRLDGATGAAEQRGGELILKAQIR